jgi:hypothetical protein
VDADFQGRPFDHSTPNQMKVLVVMTDGANTTQHRLVDDYASGLSDSWYFADHNKWSVFAPDVVHSFNWDLGDVQPTWSNGTHGGGITGPQYGGGNGNNGCGVGSGWNNGNGRGGGWNNGGRGNNNCGDDDDDDSDEDDNAGDPQGDDEGTTENQDLAENFFVVGDRDWRVLPYGELAAVQQDWQEIWANVTVRKHAEDFRYEQEWSYATYLDWRYKVYTTIDQAEKDRRMAEICTAAKQAGILIFAIGFEIGPENATKMTNCASSENYYFDVDEDTIDLAFAAIANSINQLRLVQ